MPRRIRDYLDRLSHRDTHREYTLNTTINMNDWQPVRWNTTQWFPENENTPARVHDNDVSGIYRHYMDDPTAEVFPGRTVRPSEALRRMWEENARDYEELASMRTASNDFSVPEDMLRMIRVVPNIDYLSNVVEERPMDPPPPQRHSLYIHDMDEYTPYWSNRTINWWSVDRGHVEYRRGKIIRIKRYCKI